MSRAWLVILGGIALITLSSCSGLIDSLREESEQAERESQREDAYNNGLEQQRPAQARGLSANNVNDYAGDVPSSKRGRRKQSEDNFDDPADSAAGRTDDAGAGGAQPQRRYSRADFVDNQNAENSLWNGQGQSNYYFSQNNRFDGGDLVIVTVDKSLRREIQYALWRSLPAEQRRVRMKRDPAAKDPKAAGTQPPGTPPPNGAPPAAPGAAPPGAAPQTREEAERAAAEEAGKSSMGADKDGDMIRMEIVENLGNGLLRLRGEKRVVYRGRPKFVEVSALARGHDIDEQSRANSKNFLDMRTRVVQ